MKLGDRSMAGRHLNARYTHRWTGCGECQPPAWFTRLLRVRRQRNDPVRRTSMARMSLFTRLRRKITAHVKKTAADAAKKAVRGAFKSKRR